MEAVPETLAEALHATAQRHGEVPGLRSLDGSVDLTWAEVLERVEALARGLSDAGVGPGDPVALMLDNRPEFHLTDMAVALLGGTPFSVYQTLPPEDIEHLVNNSGARVAVVEEAYLEQMLDVRERCPQLEQVYLVEGGGPEGVNDWADLEQASGESPAPAEIDPDDVLTLIYTSGTTGRSKGVELSHRAILSDAGAIQDLLRFEPGDRVISWLPTAHIAERMANYYLPLVYGLSITCCPDPKQITKAIAEVRPQWFFAVPRVWDKIKGGIEAKVGGMDDEQRSAIEHAIEQASEKVRLEQDGDEVPEELAHEVAKADDELLAPLRAALGLDAFRCLHAGGAPTPEDVLVFLHAVGLPVGELWGMSEVCGAATINPPDDVRIGTVGVALPVVELKLAEDGELLIKGEPVMKRYRGEEEKTAETFDDDGWLLTGDIAEISDDGYVSIVDRKKEIMINAAGKNMSPANIESALTSASPLVASACAIGDRRQYVTALVALDVQAAESWASERGASDGSVAELAEDEQLREDIQGAVDEANEKLARVEQVKDFAIVAEEWEAGGDELTPTMKLKRKAICEKYSEEIEALYAG